MCWFIKSKFFDMIFKYMLEFEKYLDFIIILNINEFFMIWIMIVLFFLRLNFCLNNYFFEVFLCMGWVWFLIIGFVI